MTNTVALILTVLLLALNAFFVAGEFAILSARRDQVEVALASGRRGSVAAAWALEHVSLILAVCQLGVTVASTSLGAVAEPALAHLVQTPLVNLGLPAASAHVVAVLLALLLVVYLHVVLGEMVPKNLSISAPETAVLIMAPALVWIGRAFKPVVLGLDRVANWFLLRLHVTPRSEVGAAFTAEEVANIVELSQAEGVLSDEGGLISSALEFSKAVVSEVMVPLDSLVYLPNHCTPAQLEALVSQTGFSRFPVISDDGQLQGYMHLKDVIAFPASQRQEPIPAWKWRSLVQVSGVAEVEDALATMQKNATHLAQAVDAQGTVIGVIFLEDILESLVGEVRDSMQKHIYRPD